MARLADFIEDHDLVAHNASFDQRFLDAECQRIRRRYAGAFACSMLAARRVYPDAPNHKLGTLVMFKQLPMSGTFHRALADAEMTAHLWVRMVSDIQLQYGLNAVPHDFLRALQKAPKAQINKCVEQAKRKFGL